MRIIGPLIGVVLAIVAIAFLWEQASKRPELQPDEFSRTVQSLASYAKETAVFVGQLEEDRLTAAYARTHRGKLEENVANELRTLEAKPPGNLAASVSRVRELGAKLDSTLKDLERNLGDHEALRRIREESTRSGEALARIAPAS